MYIYMYIYIYIYIVSNCIYIIFIISNIYLFLTLLIYYVEHSFHILHNKFNRRNNLQFYYGNEKLWLFIKLKNITNEKKIFKVYGRKSRKFYQKIKMESISLL